MVTRKFVPEFVPEFEESKNNIDQSNATVDRQIPLVKSRFHINEQDKYQVVYMEGCQQVKISLSKETMLWY